MESRVAELAEKVGRQVNGYLANSKSGADGTQMQLTGGKLSYPGKSAPPPQGQGVTGPGKKPSYMQQLPPAGAGGGVVDWQSHSPEDSAAALERLAQNLRQHGTMEGPSQQHTPEKGAPYNKAQLNNVEQSQSQTVIFI
jgi:hypothetical protein